MWDFQDILGLDWVSDRIYIIEYLPFWNWNDSFPSKLVNNFGFIPQKLTTVSSAPRRTRSARTRSHGSALSRSTSSWTPTWGPSAGPQVVSPHHRAPTTAVLEPTRCSPGIWLRHTTGNNFNILSDKRFQLCAEASIPCRLIYSPLLSKRWTQTKWG